MIQETIVNNRYVYSNIPVYQHAGVWGHISETLQVTLQTELAVPHLGANQAAMTLLGMWKPGDLWIGEYIAIHDWQTVPSSPYVPMGPILMSAWIGAVGVLQTIITADLADWAVMIRANNPHRADPFGAWDLLSLIAETRLTPEGAIIMARILSARIDRGAVGIHGI